LAHVWNYLLRGEPKTISPNTSTAVKPNNQRTDGHKHVERIAHRSVHFHYGLDFH